MVVVARVRLIRTDWERGQVVGPGVLTGEIAGQLTANSEYDFYI